MKPASEFAQEQRAKAVPAELKVSDWYNEEGHEQVARRGQVWGLLRWYHHTWVEPRLGFRGALREAWWRLMGRIHPVRNKRMAYRQRLMSPWEQLALRAYLEAVAAQEKAKAELEEGHRNGGGG